MRFEVLRGLLTARSDPAESPALGREYADQARTAYLGRFAPPVEHSTDRLRDIVDELAVANALDEGTGDIFDDMIDAWAAQWHAEIDAESSARRSLLELGVAEARAQLELHQAHVRWAESLLAEADRQLIEIAEPSRPAGRRFRMFGRRRPDQTE